MMTQRPRAGFTAEELIVVLGMILLAALGYTVVTSHVRGTARMCSCASNLQQLAMASRMYMTDNAGRMPTAAGHVEALFAYVKNEQVFLCLTAQVRRCGQEREDDRASGEPPVESAPEQHEPEIESDYVFNWAARSDDPAATLVVGDDEPRRHLRRTWQGARVDGAVHRFEADDWDEHWGEGTGDEPAQ